MTRPIIAIVLAAAAMSAGCIKSTPLAKQRIDQLWTLTADLVARADYKQPTVAGYSLPARWVIKQRPSVILSTISIVRASDRIEAGDWDVSFTISPTYTDTLVDLLDEARSMLERLGELAEAGGESHRDQWAKNMAKMLVQVETISRMVSLEQADPAGGTSQTGAGVAAGPLLEILAGYLNDIAGGGLATDIGPAQVGRIRAVLTQMLLTTGFELAGKELPADLRATAVTMMTRAERMDVLERSLSEFLLGRLARAPSRASQGQAARIVHVVSSWGPKALKVMQAFLRQWDKMESMSVEFRQLDGQTVVVIGVNVQPGKEIRIKDVLIGQPTLVFRGSSRITVIPSAPVTGETVVTFDAVNGGAVELRFEGVIYALVRLLALPLANGPLREVRVLVAPRKQGRQLVNVTMLSEAAGRQADPRRMLVFQDVREKRILRGPFAVSSIDQRTEQVFSYITPTRRYTYKRIKTPPPPPGEQVIRQ